MHPYRKRMRFKPDQYTHGRVSEGVSVYVLATLDALSEEKSEVSADGSKVTVSAKAITYESSADRAAMHKMNEGLVASPSGN